MMEKNRVNPRKRKSYSILHGELGDYTLENRPTKLFTTLIVKRNLGRI